MNDLTLQTMIRPLTLWVHEVGHTSYSAAMEQWRTDQLFSMLDELSNATLERVDDEHEAQFLIELAATSDPNVTTVLLRESIVVMASEFVPAAGDLDQWEVIAKRFANLIDLAAECYAAPLIAV